MSEMNIKAKVITKEDLNANKLGFPPTVHLQPDRRGRKEIRPFRRTGLQRDSVCCSC